MTTSLQHRQGSTRERYITEHVPAGWVERSVVSPPIVAPAPVPRWPPQAPLPNSLVPVSCTLLQRSTSPTRAHAAAAAAIPTLAHAPRASPLPPSAESPPRPSRDVSPPPPPPPAALRAEQPSVPRSPRGLPAAVGSEDRRTSPRRRADLLCDRLLDLQGHGLPDLDRSLSSLRTLHDALAQGIECMERGRLSDNPTLLDQGVPATDAVPATIAAPRTAPPALVPVCSSLSRETERLACVLQDIRASGDAAAAAAAQPLPTPLRRPACLPTSPLAAVLKDKVARAWDHAAVVPAAVVPAPQETHVPAHIPTRRVSTASDACSEATLAPSNNPLLRGASASAAHSMLSEAERDVPAAAVCAPLVPEAVLRHPQQAVFPAALSKRRSPRRMHSPRKFWSEDDTRFASAIQTNVAQAKDFSPPREGSVALAEEVVVGQPRSVGTGGCESPVPLTTMCSDLKAALSTLRTELKSIQT